MRSSLLLLILAAGCARASSASEPAPAPAPIPVAATDASPPPAVATVTFAEGAHAYDGKLGENTTIAMKIVRKGAEVSGTYTYLAIGRPIHIEGTVEASGDIVLNEKTSGAGGGTGGNVTGTLRLRPSGGELVGEWRDPSGKKTFPVRVSSVSTTSLLSQQAYSCIEDLECAASDAVGLAVAADDAHEPSANCFRFLEGDVVPRDPERARACFERQSAPCDGSSAFLDKSTFAVMLIDGVGGKVDVPRARALFAGCFDDVTKDAVLEYASSAPHAAPKDACELGGTTLVWNECSARSASRARERGHMAAKKIAASLDNEGHKLFVAATKAHADYVAARGRFVLDTFLGGSYAAPTAASHEGELMRKRADDLEAFASFTAKRTAKPPTEADVTRAIAAAKCENTEAAYKAYRDAEVAFYVHVFGAAQGRDEVRRAVIIELSKRRQTEC